MRLNVGYRTSIWLLFLGLFLLHAAWVQTPWIGACLALGWVGIMAASLGSRVLPEAEWIERMATGGLLTLSLHGVILGTWYYLAPFSMHAALGYVVVTSIGGIILDLTNPHRTHTTSIGWIWDARTPKQSIALDTAIVLVGILALVCTWTNLSTLATTQAVRTAWTSGTSAVMISMFCASLATVALCMYARIRVYAIALVMGWLLTLLAAGVVLFPLGYGFDPFLHQATIEHILANGTISPKPLYYAAAYAWETTLAFAFRLPINILDPWILPITTALLLPTTAYTGLKRVMSDTHAALSALALLILLPFTSLIPTTPQGFGNLLLLTTVFASLPYLSTAPRKHPILLLLPALAACAIHPIAGLPLLTYVVCVILHAQRRTHPRLSHIGMISVCVLGAIVLPASFAVNAWVSGTTGGVDLSGLTPTSLFASFNIGLFVKNGFRPVLDGAYLIGKNIIPFILVAAVVGYGRMHRARTALTPSMALAGIMLINYILLSTVVDFSFLIDYERQNYAQRLLPLAAFFAAPAFLVGTGSLLARATKQTATMRITSMILVAVCATTALYMAYPRDDAHERGRAFNTSQSDMNAVHAIERDAPSAAYAVLANQSVSAAAVRTLGFTRYYGDLYAYPIPTGGSLYTQFLAMNDTPTRDSIEQAAHILDEQCKASSTCTQTPIETMYYAVNAYWWQSDRIIEQAKNTADDWFAIDNGAVTIFRYNLTN